MKVTVFRPTASYSGGLVFVRVGDMYDPRDHQTGREHEFEKVGVFDLPQDFLKILKTRQHWFEGGKTETYWDESHIE